MSMTLLKKKKRFPNWRSESNFSGTNVRPTISTWDLSCGGLVRGHSLIWASNMLPPRLRHILRCLTFSEEKMAKKMFPNPVKALFETAMGYPIFDFIKYWPKLYNNKKLNRNMNFLITNLLSESIFDFRKWSNGKYPNMLICIFSIWPLP